MRTALLGGFFFFLFFAKMWEVANLSRPLPQREREEKQPDRRVEKHGKKLGEKKLSAPPLKGAKKECFFLSFSK